MAIFGKKKKGTKEVSAPKHRARTAANPNGLSHEIIRAPWFSEKALIGTEKGVYVFHVSPRATKAEIAGAVKDVYNVEPRTIRVVNVQGKTKSMRTKRGTGTRASRRKAYVYLNAGDSIKFA